MRIGGSGEVTLVQIRQAVELALADMQVGRYEAVSSLPDDPDPWTDYWLTAVDHGNRAAPGRFINRGSGWKCETCLQTYAWSDNLTGTVLLHLIAGQDYSVVQSGAIDACEVVLSAPGRCAVSKTGEFTFAEPTMTGRTAVPRTENGWTSAGAAVAELLFRDDGTRLWYSAVEGG